ncbi:foldase protein PrsA [Alkalibaculum bacchi]|uniref:Foldase protein PrsA n=1 Tax=Alkalibaculum bacchi TaxID=645887 RepID=A0A366IAW3_9FIRM|nr:SurA N-terminal domain-containing protein [Alkalibaculum bacchi]RBP67455.1 foldase protein PrsA [Alkalibaculum bacchi]
MIKKKSTLVALILAVIMGFSGCNMVKVNPEQDMKRVVYETKDGEVTKKRFTELLTYYEMVYQLNGYEMPKDKELTTLKEELLDTLVEIDLLKAEGVKKDPEIDPEEVQSQVEGTISNMKSGFKTEEEYKKFITDRNLTQEEFEDFIKTYTEDINYANAFIETYTDELFKSGEEAKKVAVTVNDQKLMKDELYYYLSQVELNYYMTTGSGLPTDEESIKSTYNQVQNQMAISHLVREDAKKQGIKIDDKALTEKQKEIKSQFESFYGEDVTNYLKSYYISEARYDELTKSDALTRLYEEAISENFKKDTNVTKKEIETYYKENKESYNTSTVSAKHILTTSEDLAKTIKGEIKDADTFEAALKKYQDHEEVSEAADLGEFGYKKMVAEFEKAAFELEPGQISDVVKTDFGYHIIYVYDKNIVELPTLGEKTDEIKENLLNEKVNTKLNSYKDKILKDGDVKNAKIVDPFESFINNLKEEYKVKTYPKVLN